MWGPGLSDQVVCQPDQFDHVDLTKMCKLTVGISGWDVGLDVSQGMNLPACTWLWISDLEPLTGVWQCVSDQVYLTG